MRTAPLPCLLPILFMACADPSPGPAVPPAADTTAAGPTDNELAKYRALVGHWVDRTSSDRYTSFERWVEQGDTLLSGSGYVMAGKDTVFIEDLELRIVDGQVVYSARIDSQNNGQWIPFTALPAGPDSLVFENPGHDFPQCITYVRDSARVWQVAVTGNENGRDRVERFKFKKI